MKHMHLLINTMGITLMCVYVRTSTHLRMISTCTRGTDESAASVLFLAQCGLELDWPEIALDFAQRAEMLSHTIGRLTRGTRWPPKPRKFNPRGSEIPN